MRPLKIGFIEIIMLTPRNAIYNTVNAVDVMSRYVREKYRIYVTHITNYRPPNRTRTRAGLVVSSCGTDRRRHRF